MFCVFCLTNTGFVQCYSLGCHKVCCTLVLYFASFSNFCFACFASQTSGFCSAFTLAPVKSVTRFKFCYALVSVPCLTNTGFVQCYRLGSRKVCLTLLYSVIFVLRALPHKHRVCAVLFPSAPLKFTPFCFVLFCFTQFAFVMRALPNRLWFVPWFFPGSPRICTLYFLFCIIQF